MPKTLTITNLEIEELDGIHPNGGTINTRFDASRRGGGRLRARYVLDPADHYVFSETVRAPGNPYEAVLAEEEVFPNPHKKQLRLQKVAGGERLLKLEIDLVVEEMKNGKAVGNGGPAKVFTVPIPHRVAQLLRETGQTQAAFATEIGVETHHVGRLARLQGGVSTEVAKRLPSSMEAHKEAMKKPKSKRKLKRKE